VQDVSRPPGDESRRAAFSFPVTFELTRREVRAVGNITVGRYDNPAEVGYQGWVEPDDRSWVAFVASDGSPVVFLNRDKETGAVA
jgi:hypothetical protein